MLFSNEYYPALTQPNVEVVSDAIRAVTPAVGSTADGRERELDTIILAMDSNVTTRPIADRIHGGDGRSLAEVWQGSPQALIGLTVACFPNMFMLAGPNTVGQNSIVFMIESQLQYVMDCLRHLDSRGRRRPRGPRGGHAAYNDSSTAGCRARPGIGWPPQPGTSTSTVASSFIWPGSTWPFHQRLRRFHPQEYVLRPRSAPATGSAQPAEALTGSRPPPATRTIDRERRGAACQGPDVIGHHDRSTVFITGAARGIGAATAERLYGKGANVALVGLEPELLEQNAAGLVIARPSSPAPTPRRADEDAVRRRCFGGIDGGDRQGGLLLHRAGLDDPPSRSTTTANAETAPTGARVGCAIFGFIDTDLVRASFALPSAQLLTGGSPAFLSRPAPLSKAIDVIELGVERRSARVWAPRWIGAMLIARGLLQPLIERSVGKDPARLGTEARGWRKAQRRPEGWTRATGVAARAVDQPTLTPRG